MRIISGIQPTGKLHLGNYFGAIRQFIAYQTQAEALYFIADLHALTSLKQGATLRQHSMDIALDYLALGLKPDQAILFRQSAVPQHAQLAWVLSTLTPLGLLERAHSYKDKLAHGHSVEAGLLTYPVLMAADILLYGVDAVPVGKDQKQHIEITRDLCSKFNSLYAPSQLKLPAPLMVESGALVPGTDGQKMSKSYHNTLELFAEETQLRKKIMAMPTDSTPVASPKPQPAALLSLLLLLADDAEAASLQASWRDGGVGYGTYKKRLVALCLEHFAAARAQRLQLAKHLDYVEQVLRDGAQRARQIAQPIWQQVAQAVGIDAA